MQDSYDEGGYEARSSNFKAGVGECIIKEGKELLNDILDLTGYVKELEQSGEEDAEDRIENISMLLEAMSWISHRDLVSAYLEETVKTKYTRDEDSVKMLEIILASSFFDLGVSVLTAETQSVIMNKVYLNMDNVIASTIASMTNKVESALAAMTEIQQ